MLLPERNPNSTIPRSIDDPRVWMAAERTFLAWIRTGIALMGFGFVVARFGLFLRELAAAHKLEITRGTGVSHWVGTVLLLIGVIVTFGAIVQHVRLINRLNRGEVPNNYSSAAIAVAGILAVLGLLMAINLEVLR